MNTLFLLSICLMAACASAESTLTVLTLNFACRDLYPLAACDNCQTRFDLMADAFNGGTNVEGLPDLDSVDVVIAQELGTASQNFAQISSALASRGLIYSTGEPSPRATDNICDDPLIWDGDDKDGAGDLTGLDNGGLVTWSRYPILETLKQNWCGHSLPVPAGYLVTLLDVGAGRVATVINLHAMPEYNFGVENSAEGVRSYQFGELAGLADSLARSFTANGIAFSVILGGDFNEDAYHLQSQDDGANCQLINDNLVKSKFDSVGLDVLAACQTGIIGKPTWDPTSNDLSDRFSEGSTHEVLDFLIQHSSSSASSTPVNNVSVFKTVSPWNGQFCYDTALGEVKPGNLYQSSAYALSDHNIVTASFDLPTAVSGSTSSAATAAFSNAINAWNNGEVDDAACGQIDSVCWTDADCCSGEYSWTGQGGQCNGIYCQACASLGEACGAQVEGSECCGYYDYTSGQGTHCETYSMFTTEARCVLKFQKGETCLWDEECQSGECSFTWWGKKCE